MSMSLCREVKGRKRPRVSSTFFLYSTSMGIWGLPATPPPPPLSPHLSVCASKGCCRGSQVPWQRPGWMREGQRGRGNRRQTCRVKDGGISEAQLHKAQCCHAIVHPREGWPTEVYEVHLPPTPPHSQATAPPPTKQSALPTHYSLTD